MNSWRWTSGSEIAAKKSISWCEKYRLAKDKISFLIVRCFSSTSIPIYDKKGESHSFKVTLNNSSGEKQESKKFKENQSRQEGIIVLTWESIVTPQAIKEEVWERLKCNGRGCQSSLCCHSTYQHIL